MKALAGLGFKPAFKAALAAGKLAEVEWLELLTEDFIGQRHHDWQLIEAARAHGPVALHGVSLSIGSVDPLSASYLEALERLTRVAQPDFISDHLSWSSFDQRYGYNLLPLPFNEEALTHVVERVQQVQDRLGRAISLENPARYVRLSEDELTEWAFCSEVARRSGCGLLVDLNNIFVSACNLGFDAAQWVRGVEVKHVTQFHLAGHRRLGQRAYDTHDRPIIDDVWALFELALARCGPTPTIIEWDLARPPLELMLEELRHAKRLLRA